MLNTVTMLNFLAARCLTVSRQRAAPRTMRWASEGRASAAVTQQQKPQEAQEKLDLTPPRGTRDFYPDEMALRNWLFGKWRATAAQHGFEEYDAPVLENEALYVRKAGEEVTQQLYNFEDKGGRRVALRPEMTPSLARMVMARRNGLPMPLKWFSIPQCWRYERTTRGRRREHFQWNMDIWGVPGVEAEAELLAAVVAFLEDVGLTAADVGIKVNSRAALAETIKRVAGVDADEDPARFAAVCVLVDKLEKVPAETLAPDFAELGVDEAALDSLVNALQDKEPPAALDGLFELADAYGYRDWLVFDASVVRGLAYYTGVVFEAFDRSGTLRAICGGGRYDRLLETFGGDPLPAVGFGFGDAVIVELLAMKGKLPELGTSPVDVVAYPFDTSLTSAAAAVAASLRKSGLNVDLVLESKKPKWAFKHADRRKASFVVMVAPDEWAKNEVVVKDLATSHQESLPLPDVANYILQTKQNTT